MIKNLVGNMHSKLIFKRRTEVLARDISALIPANSHVLDIGTGDGRIAQLFMRGQPNLQIEGVDVLVRERTHIPVRQFDGYTLPYSDKSVDVVTFVDVLHHADVPAHLLAEAARVARIAVIIKDHLAESKVDHLTLRLMDWIGNAPHSVALPYNYASCATWKMWFKREHLELETFTSNVLLYPWPLSALFGRSLHFIARLRPTGKNGISADNKAQQR